MMIKTSKMIEYVQVYSHVNDCVNVTDHDLDPVIVIGFKEMISESGNLMIIILIIYIFVEKKFQLIIKKIMLFDRQMKVYVLEVWNYVSFYLEYGMLMNLIVDLLNVMNAVYDLLKVIRFFCLSQKYQKIYIVIIKMMVKSIDFQKELYVKIINDYQRDVLVKLNHQKEYLVYLLLFQMENSFFYLFHLFLLSYFSKYHFQELSKVIMYYMIYYSMSSISNVLILSIPNQSIIITVDLLEISGVEIQNEIYDLVKKEEDLVELMEIS